MRYNGDKRTQRKRYMYDDDMIIQRMRYGEITKRMSIMVIR